MMMINTSLSFEKALYVIDDAIKPAYLTKVQELVLRHAWEGKTYSEIAAYYNYDSEYIKSVGCELWQLLSRSFGKQVNKSNFSQFIRRQVISVTHQQEIKGTRLSPNLIPTKNKHQDWGTAIDVSNFQGQTEKLALLKDWVNTQNSRLIIISGMLGSGKTFLATKLAQEVQEQFDYVIWRSLNNAPQVEETIQNILDFLHPQRDTDCLSNNLEVQIAELLTYLRQYRCLIIFDNLQSILDQKQCPGHYLPNYQGYGQLFRAMVGTDHQSLLIGTSAMKPKGLTFYYHNRVRFLNINGLTKKILTNLFYHRVQPNTLEQQWSELLEYYLYNPQILNVVTSTIQRLFNGEIEQFWAQKPLILEEIRQFLELEFTSLSSLEKEITYWLSITCIPATLKKLAKILIEPVSETKLREGLYSLQERSLIIKNDSVYLLHPLIKAYLQRKLIEQAVTNNRIR